MTTDWTTRDSAYLEALKAALTGPSTGNERAFIMEIGDSPAKSMTKEALVERTGLRFKVAAKTLARLRRRGLVEYHARTPTGWVLTTLGWEKHKDLIGEQTATVLPDDGAVVLLTEQEGAALLAITRRGERCYTASDVAAAAVPPMSSETATAAINGLQIAGLIRVSERGLHRTIWVPTAKGLRTVNDRRDTKPAPEPQVDAATAKAAILGAYLTAKRTGASGKDTALYVWTVLGFDATDLFDAAG